MYGILNDFINQISDKKGTEIASLKWLNYTLLNAESYKYAKSDPTLFYGLKDASAIEKIYKSYMVLTSDVAITAMEKRGCDERPQALMQMCKDAKKGVEWQLKTCGHLLSRKLFEQGIRNEQSAYSEELMLLIPAKKREF